MRALAAASVSDVAISVACLFFLLSPAFVNNRLPGGPTQLEVHFPSQTEQRPRANSSEGLNFWRGIQTGLAAGKPACSALARVDPARWPWSEYHPTDRTPKSERFENFNLSDTQIAELTRARLGAVAHAKNLGERVPFKAGTRGIVTTAPPNAFPIQTTSLWMIREAGSVLPVEVWIADRSEWEETVCGDIFPSLGAECKVMADFWPEDLPLPYQDGDIFTFKPLAMLLSSFEQFLFLDDDSFPVNNPDSLFDTEPFSSHGFVTWPDLWALTSSKYWYEIVQRPIPEIWEKASSESGQMLVNKATHGSLLVLAHFYIYYGRQFFFHLLSQGAMGHGDKETWGAAAQDLGLPWYQVKERPQRVGYKCPTNNQPLGTTHSHPLDDFKLYRNGMTRHNGSWDFAEAIHPRTLFIHHNMPKPDAAGLIDAADIPGGPFRDMFRCENATVAHRIWGARELAVATYGWDVEAAFWRGICWQACVHERDFLVWTRPSIFRVQEHLRHDTCQRMTAHWNELFSNVKWPRVVPKIGIRREIPWKSEPAKD